MRLCRDVHVTNLTIQRGPDFTETAMRMITLFAVLALTASTAALGQSGSGASTSPENKGSTGWTGAHPESGGATTDAKSAETTGQSVEVHDEAKAKTQPFVATGEDLKGAPRQLRPSKTPE